MKITHTDIYRFSIPMVPFTIATGTMTFAQNVLITIHTDEDMDGVGECSAFPMIVGETQETCLVLAKDFASIWKGKDPLDIHSRMEELNDYCAKNTTIKSAFDMALYDLSAKAAGKPLYQFLGGTKRIVETDITIGIGTPQKMAEAAEQFRKKGASMLKVKLGKKPEDDIERVRQIRAAAGKDIILRLDANQGWTYEQALKALNAMADFDIQFCEQPMRSYDDHKLPELCRKSAVKIMADESCYNHHDAQRLIEAGACHHINIKLAKSGSISEALKIQEIAGQAGIACMMGGMLETRLALTANLHLAYAGPAIQFYDMDTCMIGHLEDPVTGGVQYNQFFLETEDKPGIGAGVDQRFLDKCEMFTV